jgi:hypothetical protein
MSSSSEKQDQLPAQEDHKVRFYEDYRKVAEEYDKEFLKKYDEDLNTTLIFVSAMSTFCWAATNWRIRPVCFRP